MQGLMYPYEAPQITWPCQQDSHVTLYDMFILRNLLQQAKNDNDLGLQYAIKYGLNIYMIPFRELRLKLQGYVK